VRLGVAEIYQYPAAVDLLDAAGYDLTHPILVFLEDTVALELADFLHEYLLRDLDGVSAELLEGEVQLDRIARLRTLDVLLCLLHGDLSALVFDLFDHQHDQVQLDVSLAVFLDAHLGVGAVLLANGRGETRGKRFHQQLFVDAFFANQLVKCVGKLDTH
jgi:hypothetical protein